MTDPLLFVLTVLAILGTPGPTNALLATSGAMVGVDRSLALLPAEACGYLISILVLRLALGPVMAASPIIGTGLRLAAAAYLFWLALQLWGHSVVAPDAPATSRPVAPATIRPRQVFVATLLNPKAVIFALGVIPFGAANVWRYLLGFVGLLAVVGFGWILTGSRMGRMARASGRGRVAPRIGAIAVGLFATLIILSPFLR